VEVDLLRRPAPVLDKPLRHTSRENTDDVAKALMSPGDLQARDLLLLVDRSRPPLARQLEEQMRRAIQSGALAAGGQLPSTRVLADDLGVSRGVIMRVYGQLAAEGYISLRQGAAPTVRPTARLDPEAVGPPNGRPRAVYNLRPHLPEVATFPRRSWLRAVCESIEQAQAADLTYGDEAGLWALRVEVANYLSRARGVHARPERTVITAGSTHALSLVSRVLARRGRTLMAFENPSHSILRAVASHAGQTVVPAAVDGRGIRPAAIEAAHSVYVTPAHQFPTGVALAPERRTGLIEWARKADALILEDDYDAEFRYDRAPIGALQGLAPDRVVYMGSTGKTLAPGLRLGWAVLPLEMVDDVSQELLHSMLQVSGFDQLAFTSFVQRGDFDRHLRRMRQLYRARRDLAVSLLSALLPNHRVRGIAAGLHVVLEMPSHAAATAVRAEAEAAGMILESLDQHAFADYTGPAGLLVGYGGLPEPSLEQAIRALVRIIQGTAPQARRLAEPS
jgi:GntR family transcriptional regulator/MocR family aminotransferase